MGLKSCHGNGHEKTTIASAQINKDNRSVLSLLFFFYRLSIICIYPSDYSAVAPGKGVSPIGNPSFHHFFFVVAVVVLGMNFQGLCFLTCVKPGLSNKAAAASTIIARWLSQSYQLSETCAQMSNILSIINARGIFSSPLDYSIFHSLLPIGKKCT